MWATTLGLLPGSVWAREDIAPLAPLPGAKSKLALVELCPEGSGVAVCDTDTPGPVFGVLACGLVTVGTSMMALRKLLLSLSLLVCAWYV